MIVMGRAGVVLGMAAVLDHAVMLGHVVAMVVGRVSHDL